MENKSDGMAGISASNPQGYPGFGKGFFGLLIIAVLLLAPLACVAFKWRWMYSVYVYWQIDTSRKNEQNVHFACDITTTGKNSLVDFLALHGSRFHAMYKNPKLYSAVFLFGDTYLIEFDNPVINACEYVIFSGQSAVCIGTKLLG